jgi:uncharacterized protein (TIGR02646 family)
MIKINRGPAPATLRVYSAKTVKAMDRKTMVTKAEQELEKAIAFFTDPANFKNEEKLTDQKFNFEVYRNPELVEALEKVFGKKCAYCEGNFAHVTPKDIEHFRPKSEIATGVNTLRPGYFWLACEWENLLVSCPDCNRSRHHDVPGQDAKVKLGKETQFPLSDEGFRLRKQGSLVNEEGVRLLLDPCTDDPEQHLTFDVKGLIHARSDGNGKLSAKGAASITVFALQRKDLVEDRLRVLNDLRFCISEMGDWAENHNELTALGASQAQLDRNLDQIRKVRDKFREMLALNAPYQAMLREWIREGTRRGDFAKLEQFNIRLIDEI